MTTAITRVLLFFFILLPGLLPAQETVAIETKEVWVTIIYTHQSNDTIVALLDATDKIGLSTGQLIRAYRNSAKEVPGVSEAKEFGEVGAGFIVMSDTLPFAYIRLYKTADTLVAGDQVQLNLQVPSLKSRGIFSELGFLNIIFTDAEKEPLYSLDYVIHRDSRQTEDSLYNIIAESLHSTYEAVKDRTDLPEMLTAKLYYGRFKGRTPMEVLRDATKKDIESFFLYVSEYPVGYIGKNFRASESFAGWLVSNSPYSAGEVKRGLFPYYKNKEELKKRLPEYKADVLSEHTAATLARNAIALSDKQQFTEAHELADFALVLAEVVNDTASKPVACISKAQLLLDEDKYTEAVTWCDKAITTARLAKDRDIEVQAIIKKGYCYYKISRYAETERTFNGARQKLEDYRKELGEDKYYTSRRKILEYTASLRYNSGKYAEALLLLDSAIVFNKRVNSYDAHVSNAGYYYFIGQVYNEQGRPGEALEAFRQADTIYRGMLDVLKMGKVENEMAQSFYQMGNYQASIDKSNEALRKLLAKKDYNAAGYSRSLAGNSFQAAGNYDSAMAANFQAIEWRKKSGNIFGQAVAWENIANVYRLSGSRKLALQAYDTASYLYKKIKDSTNLADVYNGIGRVYLGDENYKKAVEWFETARGMSDKSTVQALYRLGTAWQSIDTAKARLYFLQARNKSLEDGNISYQFDANHALAGLSYYALDSVAGDKYYQQCMELSARMQTANATASCLSLKGYRYENATELDSAMYYYSQAMAITDTADKSESISLLNKMAGLLISKGEFGPAESLLTKAIQIAGDIADTLALGSTLQYSSFLYSLTAAFEKGLVSSDSAIAIFTKSGHRIRLAGAYGSRGTLYNSIGDNKRSVQAYLFADTLYKEELQEEQRGAIFNNIGIVYTGQGDYASALKYLQRALGTIRKGVVNESYLLTQGNIADCYVGLKKNKEAKELLLDILPKAQKMKLNRIASGMALVLGKIYLEEGKLSDAGQYYQYARDYAAASGEQEKMIDALVNLGRIHVKENDTVQAKANLLQGANLVKKYKIVSGWEAFYELGLLHYNNQQSDSAIIYFIQAVELLDRNAENLYGGEEAKKIFDNDPRKAELYNKLVFAFYNTGNINEAWAYANRSNIAGIKELSGSLSVNSSNQERNEALKKLLAMQQSKKALKNTLEKQEGTARQETLKKIEILEADYNNFLQDVVELYPELSTYFSRSNADEFNNYKGKLPADVAVALYLVNDKTLMIFTLTNEKLAVDTMTLDIAPKITTFIETIKNVNRQTGTGPLSERSEPQDEEKTAGGVEFKDISDELYQALITTVYDKIGNKKKLCIIPTGVFSNMPFQCLGKKVDTTTFRFLIEDHLIFYTNKMSIFNKGKSDDTAADSLTSFAAFGVPDATLRFNIAEVKAIGKILGADSTIYADARATESMAKKSLRNKKYIHFATHGVLNYSSDYSQSYLKLLPDKDTTGGNNGQLTMREVQKLGITDCNMVILSACQTAVTKQLVKGWNISPANSFLVSNVKTVVASLWKVADEPTGLLMEYFYENLSKKMEKAEALRQAQIRLSQDARFRHPNYWGAFVLYGEWK